MLSPERKKCLTATDMTILLGTVPVEWGTPKSVWMDKVGIPSTRRASLAMTLGSRLEEFIFAELGIPESNQQAWKMRTDIPIGATADAIMDGRGFELKTTISDEFGDDVPDRVKVQCQTGMMAHGLREWSVYAFVMSRESREEIVRRLIDVNHTGHLFAGLDIERKKYDLIYDEKLTRVS